MSDVLFVTWDGGGNLPPALGVAAEMARRSHRVRFLGHAQQREKIETAGFAFDAFAHARPWTSAAPHPGLKGAIDMVGVFTDRGTGVDLLEVVRREPADLVVVDCLLFGALEAAERAGLRRAALVHTVYSQQREVWSTSLGGLLTRMRRMRLPDMWLRTDAVLVTALPEVDRCGDVPSQVRHTGPVWPEARPEPASPDANVPLVLVSLSTMHQDGQEEALQAISDGLATLPVRALVTTGPSIDPAALRAAANVEVHRYVPHEEVMPRASLVICHGGHSTAMAALARDLPLVIMPMFARGYQPVVGRALRDLGAARVLPKTAKARQIAAITREMLANDSYRVAARKLGAEIRRRDGAVVAADALEAIAQRHRQSIKAMLHRLP